jgi:single-stranded DNA-binding protein
VSGIDAAFMATIHRAEAKTSASGKPYLRINARVGEGDAVTWVNVLAFDPEAIAAVNRFVKDARIYVEGRLSLSEWTNSAGEKRYGLSVMSFHCRLARIGRNRPKKQEQAGPERAPARPKLAASENSFYSDEIPL